MPQPSATGLTASLHESPVPHAADEPYGSPVLEFSGFNEKCLKVSNLVIAAHFRHVVSEYRRTLSG